MPRVATAFVLLTVAATALPAQSAPCLRGNDQTTNVTNLLYSYHPAAPGHYAWQVSPPSALVAQSLQVFTGNAYGANNGCYMSLEIWDDSPSTPGLPGARLAGGTWRFEPPIGWQGTNLDAPVSMLPGTNYWIVLIEPGWSTPPIEPGGVAVPYAANTGSGWTAAGTAALKFRVFCDWLEQTNVATFGSPCPGSTGGLGTGFTSRAPFVGNGDFRIEGTGFAPATPILLIAGTVPGYPNVPVPGTAGCELNTNWEVAVADVTGTGTVRSGCASCATPAAAGHVTFPVPVPGSPGLAGFYFAAQFVALDLASVQPLPFVSSNALQVTVY